MSFKKINRNRVGKGGTFRDLVSARPTVALQVGCSYFDSAACMQIFCAQCGSKVLLGDGAAGNGEAFNSSHTHSCLSDSAAKGVYSAARLHGADVRWVT
jgi:hypothetical protein